MNGIEKDLDGTAEVVRVDLHSSLGKDIARHFDVTSAKTTLLLDAKGEIVYRYTGRPDRKKIVALANE